MKKILFVLVISTIAMNVAHAQSNWINYKMDNKISVKLPAQPQPAQEGGTMVQDKDSLIYLTVLVDFVKTANVDSTALAPYLSSQQFA
ncbi:MAG: hypothetical protein JWP44_1808, partial [Mucilaginibacter sp.]|nr:hypothetical protein [Mucilaginibacter sp.]